MKPLIWLGRFLNSKTGWILLWIIAASVTVFTIYVCLREALYAWH